jgi:hypothetical protein
MPRRRAVLFLVALAALFLWHRSRPGERVEVVYADGSVLVLDGGVEADDLLADARELLATLS